MEEEKKVKKDIFDIEVLDSLKLAGELYNRLRGAPEAIPGPADVIQGLWFGDQLLTFRPDTIFAPQPVFLDMFSPFYLSGPFTAFIDELVAGGKQNAEKYAEDIRKETFELLAPQIQASYFPKGDEKNDAHETGENAVYKYIEKLSKGGRIDKDTLKAIETIAGPYLSAIENLGNVGGQTVGHIGTTIGSYSNILNIIFRSYNKKSKK